MNYLNITSNAFAKKNRFIWLFSISTISLYWLLSAAAEAAICVDINIGTPPIELEMRALFSEEKYSNDKVVRHLVKCELTSNNESVTINIKQTISGNPINNNTAPTGTAGLFFSVVNSTSRNECNIYNGGQNKNNVDSFICNFQNNVADETIIVLETKISALKERDFSVNKRIEQPFVADVSYYNTSLGISSSQQIQYLNIPLKINSTSYGCTLNTPDINFNLGAQQQKYFTGIGSKGRDNTQQLKLTCDPNTKYFLKIDGDAELSQQGILKLTPESGAASGVGVQLLVGKNQDPVVFGQPKQMGTTANGTNLPEEIDITARYYQTENTVTPGTANANATFTMTYQ